MLTDLALFMLALSATLFLSYPLFWMAPFLVFMFYRCPLIHAIIWSIAAGLVIDLASSPLRFGVIPLLMCATTLLLYGRKQHFFYDSLSTFPIMTALYSFIYTVFLAIASNIPLSLPWIASDLILMPLSDALLAFVSVTLPLLYFGPKRRKGEDYFL